MEKAQPLALSPDRFFDPNPAQRRLARALYAAVAGLPIVSPHGHVDPRLLADPAASLGTPAELFIIADHYVFRLLYSQGVPLEALGVPRADGSPVETDHRKIWQRFAEHFHLFSATPSGMWLRQEMAEVFGIRRALSATNAQAIYDEISAKLETHEFRPRALFERFNIEVLATTDGACDPLHSHLALRASGWTGRVIPTFRPDALIHLLTPGWAQQIEALSQASGMSISSHATFIQALEDRRSHFRRMGAVATDQSAETPAAGWLGSAEVETIFQHALRGRATPDEARRYHAHLLMEMARMSCEDGLVMQLHAGIVRGHNRFVHDQFGPDKGGDIPVRCEFTRNLRPLLDSFGNDPRLALILFTLDETAYSRELAPLAGGYPAVRLGPPWWFHDSPNGMRRYLDQVMETAGLYNTAGFNDDTRAFCSIPARHDVWRRVSCDWLAGLVIRGQLSDSEAPAMAHDLAIGLARRAYRLTTGRPAQ